MLCDFPSRARHLSPVPVAHIPDLYLPSRARHLSPGALDSIRFFHLPSRARHLSLGEGVFGQRQ